MAIANGLTLPTTVEEIMIQRLFDLAEDAEDPDSRSADLIAESLSDHSEEVDGINPLDLVYDLMLGLSGGRAGKVIELDTLYYATEGMLHRAEVDEAIDAWVGLNVHYRPSPDTCALVHNLELD